jgi:membrane fusion protein, multidrug efflux system
MNIKAPNLKKAIFFIISMVLLAVVIIKLKNNKEITQDKIYQFNKEEAIYIQADTLELENINADFSYSGTFEPNKETKLSAEIQGKVNEVLVDIGSIVTKGQVLVQLDNSLLKLQYQSTEVQEEGLQADVNRYTTLANADAIQGVQLEKSILGLKSAKLQKATLLEQINKTTIKAPFNGIVTSKLSEEGAFAAPGVPLLQIMDITNLKFTVNVPESELNKFNINHNYSLSADAYPDINLTGICSMIGSKANLGSGFPIQFTVRNTPGLELKSGMFGKVNLKINVQRSGILISSSSIVGSANQPQVYLIRNNKAFIQNIKVSNKTENKSVVSSGLKAGDIIVKNGFINLFDGANVIIK